MAAIVVVGLVVVGLGAVLLLGGDDDAVETVDADTASAADGDQASATAPESTSTTSRSSSTTAPASTPPSVESATGSTNGSTNGSTTGTSPLPAGTWITVLSSIPVGASDLDARVAELRSEVGSVSTLVSDGYASLTPGFVVVYAGSSPSGPAALDRCYALGRTSSSTCYAAPLTQSPADRSNRLYP